MSDPDPAGLLTHAFDSPRHEPFDLPGSAGGALLVHGFMGTPRDMRPLAAALNAQGWQTCSPLLPGFGKEVTTLPDRRMEDWAAVIRAALSELQQRHPRTLLVGHSLGGGLALQLAAELQPDGLALLAPFWTVDVWLWRTLPILHYFARNIRVFSLHELDFNDPETRRGLATFLPGADLDDPAMQQAILQFSLPTRLFNQARRAGQAGHQRAPEIRSKTLVLQGSQDKLVTPALTRKLIMALPTPPRYVEVAGEHLINDDESPSWPIVQREVLDLAAALLKQASPPAAG
ncbi:MAG: alpha/beta fold hydrolase [Anaerolineae bacterium]|nr:alpha/beta fold hydrolase [Anaerolineae bacterium]